MKSFSFVLLVTLSCCLIGCKNEPEVNQKLNVLFIAVDDLRPELGCYGKTYMHTPNFDRLAETGMLFENAYCSQAVCAPSRNGVMTGLRPDALNIYNLGTFFRTQVPGVTTLSQHFKNNGYHAESLGKIYHRGHGNQDDSLSWSVKSWFPGRNQEVEAITRGDTVGLEGSYPHVDGARIAYYASEVAEEQLHDTKIADKAIERLGQLQDSSFFLAVGFLKPHLPFVAPQKYWNFYNPDDIEIPTVQADENLPKYSKTNWGELRKYHAISPEGPLNEETARGMIHGYYAAVSYIDAQLGKLLDALDSLGMSENTVVVLWGDHGWKLGEYQDWCKHTNFELDTRSVLMMRTPGMGAKGEKSSRLAEYIDIYPSVCEAAGLPLPEHLQGRSLLPLLDEPTKVWKQVALSQYPRGTVMGYSLRNERYRYVSWQQDKDPEQVMAEELYDHQNDPMETNNLAGTQDSEAVLQQMRSLLDSVRQATPLVWKQYL